MAGDGEPSRTAPEPPALLVVDPDSNDLQCTAAALHHRFGRDYRILTAGSAAAGLAGLKRRAEHGDQVALVASELHLPDDDGIRFLSRAADLHPGIARVLLFAMDEYHTRIPFRELPALQRASALGQIDFWMVKGWVNPEEWLYPQVQEALSAWSTAHSVGCRIRLHASGHCPEHRRRPTHAHTRRR